MEIQVAKLRDILALLEPAVPKRISLPVLAHIRLGDGRAVATDLETAVMADLPEAVDPLLLPVKPVMEFLSYTPGHQEARITAYKGEIAIAVDSAEARFKALAPEEFPPLPQLQPQNEGVLDGDALVRALGVVLPYTATEDSRPVLNGVCLTPGDNVEVVGADGFRLAWETVPGRLAGDRHLVIPAGTVSLLMNLWKKAAAPDLTDFSHPAQVAIAKRLIRLQWGEGMLQQAVLMPLFVNWKGATPRQVGAGGGDGEGVVEEPPVDEEALTAEGSDQGPDEEIPGPADETPEPVAAAEVKPKRRRKDSKA